MNSFNIIGINSFWVGKYDVVICIIGFKLWIVINVFVEIEMDLMVVVVSGEFWVGWIIFVDDVVLVLIEEWSVLRDLVYCIEDVVGKVLKWNVFVG